jgi:glycosyltransferase involved in cell wall biosynthesis
MKDRAGPKLSVITPSYNQAAYLEQTIDSVLSQGIEDLEYIIMDGGSQDGSVDVIKKYAKHLAYWQSTPDGGQVNALSAGFRRCTGDIYCWLNSDDMFTPGTLRKVRVRFQEDENLELIYGDYFVLQPDGRLIAKPKIAFDFDICLAVFLMIPQSSAFWTRRIYDSVGGLNCDYQYSFDYDLFLKIGQAVKNRPNAIQNVHDYWSTFRIHDASKTVRENHMLRADAKRIRISFGFPRFRPYKRCIQFYQSARTLIAFHRERGFVPTKGEKAKL